MSNPHSVSQACQRPRSFTPPRHSTVNRPKVEQYSFTTQHHIVIYTTSFTNCTHIYRPVAITSNVVKSLERILTEELRKEVGPRLDQYQFAYSKNRSTCDAISTLAHLTLKHLEGKEAYARLLFIDFSSAFNTIHPDILLYKLAQLDVNPFIIKWYFSFLSERPQRVRFNSVFSEETRCSTGVPQGTVSSSFLFTLYTDDCVSSNPNQFVLKFSP